MKWKIKTIRQKTNVGSQLKKARLAKGLTYGRINALHCIPQTFMEAVEKNDFNTLPDTVYTKAMLKKYIGILGLAPSEYVELWEEAHSHWEALEHHTISERDIRQAKKPYSRWAITPAFFQKGFVVVFSTVLLVYIGVRVDAAIAPTELILYSPDDQVTIDEQNIIVSGKTEPEVVVRINRFSVSVEDDGSFTEKVTLHEGLNVLEIEATKKYRPPNITIRHILVTDSKEK